MQIELLDAEREQTQVLRFAVTCNLNSYNYKLIISVIYTGIN